jgi:hypothetical protein
MLRHSTNLPDALRIASEREALAERGLPHRYAAGSPEKHVLRVRPSFVRVPRGRIRIDEGDEVSRPRSR